MIENKTQETQNKKNPAIKHLVKPEGNPKNPIVKTKIGKTFLANLNSDIKFKEHTYTLYESITFKEIREGYLNICIRVTPKHRASWVIFYKPKKGVSERTYKIASYEDISRDKAVELAKELREAISEGIHPEDARRQKKTAVGPTLKECMEDKIQSRGLRPHRRKGLAASTVESYRKLMNIVDDYGLANIPMTEITSQKIREMHDSIPIDVMRRGYKRGDGWSTASKVVGLINGLYNFASKKYETEDVPAKKIITHNPCDPMRATKSVGGDHRIVNASERSVRQEDLAKFWQVLESLKNYVPERHNKNVQSHIVGYAYLKFMLLTGMRGGALSNLKFRMYRDKIIWVVGDDKFLMKTDNEFMLPLSEEAAEVVEDMYKRHGSYSEYIFPNISGTAGAEIGVPRWIQWVREQLGIDFIAHGLRSTYITCAVSCKVDKVIYKKLIDHGNQPQDVTSGYTRSEIEIMRDETQRITDFILYNAGIKSKPKEKEFTADGNPFSISDKLHKEIVDLSEKEDQSVKDTYEMCIKIGAFAHKYPEMQAKQLLDMLAIH